MRRFLEDGYFGAALLLAAALTCVGCRPAVERRHASPPPGTTESPSTTMAPSAPPSVTVSRFAALEPAVEQSGGGQQVALAEPETATRAPASMKMVPIQIDLPSPAFRGTPVPLKEPNVEKPKGAPRPPFLAPEGTVNLARGKRVTAGDPAPAAGELDFVTDDEKDASDFGYLELRPGSEWVQVDLGQKAAVYAVIVWHNHAEARVYRDVIVQVSDDPDFLEAATVFNNDYDNSSGLGIGQDMGYVETSEGRLVNAKGEEGRYVRLYSNGSHVDDKNHYTEVAVYGRPVQ